MARSCPKNNTTASPNRLSSCIGLQTILVPIVLYKINLVL